ncbi:MAG: acyl-CoA dehydrogenase family protein [Thermodesulfobacteriota bacterium]|nr:acyl-CoA dehydrogenase family protein [Thermodesulfobacteriota bacterium]
MDFSLSEEQEMLKKTAHDFLTKECPPSFVKETIKDERGYSIDMWKKMADLGWMGLIFPEPYGGMEGSFLDITVLLEEMGKASLISPFFSSVILGGLALLEGGNEKQKDTFLPKVIQGDVLFTLAITEPNGKYSSDGIESTAAKSGEGYIINGTKLFVPYAHVADHIVIVARTGNGLGPDGITLFIVDSKTPGITYTPLITIAGEKEFEVTLDQVEVSYESVLGDLNRGWPIIEKVWPKVIVAKCAEMVGGAQQALEIAINYAKEREQFGRPIGTLQAVQHFCSDMVTDVDACRYITYQAAWMLSCGYPCAKEVAMAKAWCSDAFKRVTAKGQQIHGAIGFTEEHDLHLYYKNAKSWELLYGDSTFHREIVAQQMGM